MSRVLSLSLLMLALTATPAFALGDDSLQEAREASGVEHVPDATYALPAGDLHVTPVERLAGSGPQSLRFAVHLDRAVGRARLEVELPHRWVKDPEGGVETTLPAHETSDRGHDETVREHGALVRVDVEDGRAGDTLAWEIVDNGIPVGDYHLPVVWEETGEHHLAGPVELRVYMPDRDATAEQHAKYARNPWSRLLSPSAAINTSADSSDHSESHDVVVPGNPNRYAAADNNDDSAVYLTDNRGASFKKIALPRRMAVPGGAIEPVSPGGDAMFAADPEGDIWYGELQSASKKSENRSRIIVDRIPAGTSAFRPDVVGLKRNPADQKGQQDKNLMTIDNTPTSPTYGRLYVVWGDTSTRMVLVHCDTRPGGRLDAARCDDPDHWSAPVAITPHTGSYIYADAAVAPSGKVFVTWWDFSSANAIRGATCDPSSADCDETGSWSIKTIATLNEDHGRGQTFACPILAQPGGRAGPQPNIDIDHSGGPNTGRVYVAWGQLRADSGTTRCDKPIRPAASHLTWDVYVASADDALPGAAEPSEHVATRLYTDGEDAGAPNSDDWFPWIAVDQTTGQAWAAFYSTRQDPTRRKADFFLRSVTPADDGLDLGPLVRLTSQSSDASHEECCSFGNDYGDYVGLDATSGVLFPAWTDIRTRSPHLYTAVLTAGQAQ